MVASPTILNLLSIAATLLPLIAAISGVPLNRNVVLLSADGLAQADIDSGLFRFPGRPASENRFHLEYPVNSQDGTLPVDTAFERRVNIDGVPTWVQCHLSGVMAPGVYRAEFRFSDGKQYLSRCGAGADGITVTCEGPAADCTGRWV